MWIDCAFNIEETNNILKLYVKKSIFENKRINLCHRDALRKFNRA